MYSAYLDRFTDNHQALILVESLQKEFHVQTSSLPTGSNEGSWLLVEIQGDAVTSLQLDEKKTQDMKRDTQNRLERLKSKKLSRFKRG
ncbi:DUF3006 domain-containing protein [Sporosarcina sp. Marseille-Q4063]|uniref:DUF3006 domain-containing protein n=1 Tax=Sporosarcina sp. Marseille-Q4063 TaxID=2810514 RepID=UPI001BAE67C3|nr:DUF3006 domain-containing protein [Sporosarcina sp. Marseille-Q4063]QUW23121.1 DUF3006 domain-containing protein [Sporosarcina sp. Marseille-Q4063]